MVLQTRIFFFWSTTFLQPEKMWIYGIKPPFFLVNHFSRTRFLEPDFSNQISRTRFLEPDFLNQISKNCKNRGRRIKGPVDHCNDQTNKQFSQKSKSLWFFGFCFIWFRCCRDSGKHRGWARDVNWFDCLFV